jgi:cell division protein FtsN
LSPDNASAGVKNQAGQNVGKPEPEAAQVEARESTARRPFTIRLASYNTPESAKAAAAYFAGRSLSPIAVKVRFQQEAWWILYLGAFPGSQGARAALASWGLPAAEVLPMPYAIKTGTFASSEKAADEQDRLERLGVFSYALRCGGSGETALFTGAFNSRELAQAELKELSGRGISGTVSYLATPGDMPDPPPAGPEALKP